MSSSINKEQLAQWLPWLRGLRIRGAAAALRSPRFPLQPVHSGPRRCRGGLGRAGGGGRFLVDLSGGGSNSVQGREPGPRAGPCYRPAVWGGEGRPWALSRPRSPRPCPGRAPWGAPSCFTQLALLCYRPREDEVSLKQFWIGSLLIRIYPYCFHLSSDVTLPQLLGHTWNSFNSGR